MISFSNCKYILLDIVAYKIKAKEPRREERRYCTNDLREKMKKLKMVVQTLTTVAADQTSIHALMSRLKPTAKLEN